MDLTEKTLSREDCFDGKLVHVHVDQVRLPNGQTAAREVVDHVDGVAVLPLDPPQTVHLGIALPEEEHVSPAAKRFITYALDRLPELDVL